MYKIVSIVLPFIVLLSLLKVDVCHVATGLNGADENELVRKEVIRLLERSYECHSYKTETIDKDFTLNRDIDLTGIFVLNL